MAKHQKRSHRKPFRVLIGVGVIVLIFGFVIWSLHQLVPTLFPTWFDKVLLIMTGLGALLTLLGTAITNVVIPIRKLTQEESTTDKRSLVDSKPIRRVKYETLIARLGRSGKIPWIDRDIANPGLLREHGRVAIVGWMKSGKTREAAEIIRMATEDGVVSAIYEPTSALDLISEESLSEAVAFQIDDREKTLFFVDELGLRPEVERLERLSQCLETITRLRSDTYYLITIQKERLTDSVRNWLIAHDFHLLGMEALTINQRQELVQTAKKILDFNITPDAVAKLANETDGRPYSLVFTLQQASRETELDQALIEKLLSQSEEEAWAEQRRNIISSEPTAELLLESIVTFISAGVTPRSSSIRQYSYYLSKYQKQRQKFFQLLSDATNQWAKFDIVETEGLFTIPEPLILPLLKDNDQARVKLGDFVRNFEASWFDIFPLKLIEALDLIFNTSAWKNISRRTANFKPPKKYWEFYNSPAWKRAMSWLTDGLFNWPVDRILLKIELGENTSQGNYLFSNALIERGRKAVSEKKFRDSIIYYTKAISLNQNNARAYIYRSLAYRNIGNLDEAIADQTKACEIEPGYSWCVAQRGVSYRLMERYEDAIKDFNQAIQLDNKYDFAIAQRGIVYRLMERYEDAIKDFNQALKLDSEDDLAIAQRGVTYRLMERYEDAIKDFNQALKLDNEDDWTIAQRGVTYRLMERYEDAIKDFNQALKLDNEDGWTIAQRGVTYRLMERYEDAIKDFNQALKLDSEDGWAIAQRGITYRCMGQYEDAIEDFNQALKLDSEDGWAIAQRGITYRCMGQYEDAIEDFNQAIELDNKFDWAIAQRGITYRCMKRYDDATKDFDRAIELSNEHDWTISHRSFNHLLGGQYRKAFKDISRSLEIKPKSDWYLYLKALVCLNLGESQDAMDSLCQSISLARETYSKSPNNYGNSFNLALYHLANGSVEESIRLYQSILSRCTNAHDFNLAIFDLEEFLKIIPGCQDALTILQLARNKLGELRRGE